MLTNSKEHFLTNVGTKINYSTEKIGEESFWIVPYGLLDEIDLREFEINIFEWEGQKAFFATGGDLPFDIFSAAFYLLSRYEEYLPHTLDEYGRYAHTNSIAFKEAFLNFPIVNLWVQHFSELLCKRMVNTITIPPMAGQNSCFHFVPTYDIDIAYCYLHRPKWKNVMGFFRDLLQGKFEKILERAKVYSGRAKDPFDTFDWIDSLHIKCRLDPIYFFLTILKRGEYDKNLSANSGALQQLYKKLSSKYTTGIHPSWQSGTDTYLLDKEIKRLENILQRQVSISRNHYLRFSIPGTYQRLLNAGITDDYSMGYAAINGFRASYALPFHWYDLKEEKITDLVIHPFCFMEANSYFHQGFSAVEAGEELQFYHDLVKQVNGEFITLFHNHFLTEQPEWIEWREMYENFLQKNFD